MKNKYRDRGIIKWAPFDSLVNTSELLEDLYESLIQVNMFKVEKKSLEDISDCLSGSLNRKQKISVYFHINDITNRVESTVKEISKSEGKIILENGKILNIKDIINCEYIEEEIAN